MQMQTEGTLVRHLVVVIGLIVAVSGVPLAAQQETPSLVEIQQILARQQDLIDTQSDQIRSQREQIEQQAQHLAEQQAVLQTLQSRVDEMSVAQGSGRAERERDRPSRTTGGDRGGPGEAARHSGGRPPRGRAPRLDSAPGHESVRPTGGVRSARPGRIVSTRSDPTTDSWSARFRSREPRTLTRCAGWPSRHSALGSTSTCAWTRVSASSGPSSKATSPVTGGNRQLPPTARVRTVQGVPDRPDVVHVLRSEGDTGGSRLRGLERPDQFPSTDGPAGAGSPRAAGGSPWVSRIRRRRSQAATA